MLSMDFPSNLLVILPQFCWLIPFQSLQSWWFFNEISQSLISFIKLTDKVWLVDIEYLQVSKRMMTWKQFFFPTHPSKTRSSNWIIPRLSGAKRKHDRSNGRKCFQSAQRTVLSCVARRFQFLWKKCTGAKWWKKQSSFRARITTVVST